MWSNQIISAARELKGSITVPEMQLELLKLIGVLVLLAANAFFVAVEFAVVSVPSTRVDQLAAKGHVVARLAQTLLGKTNRVLAAAQVGITMASLGIGWLGEDAVGYFLQLLGGGVIADHGLVTTISLLIAFIFITSIHIVIGEQVPKMVAITHATPTLLLITRPMRIFDTVMHPFVFILDRATEAILGLFHLKPLGQHKIVYTADELKQLVSESQHRGEIEPVEREIIHHAFEFADRTLEEVMIPRTAMVALEQAATVADFLKLYDETGHTRFPVYAGSLDNIVGFVWAKDILRTLARDPAARQSAIQPFMRNAVFVPGSKHVGALFTEMRHRQTQLAIVIDEYGGTAGMVTAEEIIQEVVGRIGDELAATPSPLNKLDEANAIADATLRIDEVNEQLAVQLPESENYETVAGLVLEELRRIPQPGDSITLGDIIITVREMKGQKIERVLITKLLPRKE